MNPEASLVGSIAARWAEVQARIARAADAAGREPDAVRVVAVTKGLGLDVVHAARTVGLTAFGENRVQEAEAKVRTVPDAEWHLVGHLQSNKARRAAAAFASVDSVDGLDLLARIDVAAHDLGVWTRVLLQVNLLAVPGQHGFEPAWLTAAAADGRLGAALRRADHAWVSGLMAIGPFTTEATASRAAFAALRELRDRLETTTGHPLPVLSMGMSGDFEAAIAEGANELRLGGALFGPRPDPAILPT